VADVRVGVLLLFLEQFEVLLFVWKEGRDNAVE
jgi:hypothetical protein